MPLYAALEASRNAIRQGDTASAIKTLIDRLSREPDQVEVVRALLVVEAAFNTTKQQEVKGLIAFDEAQRAYNKANDAVLSIIDQLASGSPTLPRNPKPTRRVVLYGGSALLLISIVFALFNLLKKDDCPAWGKNAGLRVMILPFESYGGPVRDPASALSDSIRILTRKNNLRVSVKTSALHSKRPLDPDEARRIGSKCAADLIVWGRYAVDEQNRVRVRMGHAFVKTGKGEQASSVQNFQDITEIGPERSLRDAILGVCTRIALHEGNWDAAMKWLRKMDAPDRQEKEQMERLERRLPDGNPKRSNGAPQ